MSHGLTALMACSFIHSGGTDMSLSAYYVPDSHRFTHWVTTAY